MPDHSVHWLAGGFFTLWFASLGACFGSFLNVVVWRMPRNKPLVFGGSACPKCNTPILFRDNIPIFGWIALRGKCRACALPISPRYPIVETIAAAIFLIFFLLEVIGHGLMLPAWFEEHHGNWLTELPGCEFLGVYLRHVTLLYFLLGMALMDWDQQRVPLRLTGFAVGLSLVYTLLMPASLPLPLAPGLSALDINATYLSAATNWGLNASLSLCISLVIPTTSHFAPLGKRLLILQMILVIGCYVGWQVALVMACVSGLVLVLQQAESRLPLGMIVFASTLIFLSFWNMLDATSLWILGQTTASLSLRESIVILMALGFACVAITVIRNSVPTR